jgi:aspartyl-tRNA(Asn)/glutamyl-tRNA(Gln) amidotransferase subunit C
MISGDEVKKLANLARMKLTPEEEQSLSKDMGNILEYVHQIQKVSAGDEDRDMSAIRNIMRDDAMPHESGLHTEELLAEAPEREGNYVKVKKIL